MKIIILIMNAKFERFKIQTKHMKDSLRKQIDKYNLNDEIFVYDYIGSYKDNYNKSTFIDNDTIYCKSGDSESFTYLKTLDALEFIEDNIEYDYIFRTNTSTFINVKLLYEFIKEIKSHSKEIIYTSALLSLNNTYVPNKKDIMCQGKGLLLNKYLVKTLLDNRYISIDNNDYKYAGSFFRNNKMFYADDTQISSVFNLLHIINKENYVDYLYTFNHLNSYDILNDDLKNDFYFLKHFITICIKDEINKDNYNLNSIETLTNLFINNTIENTNQLVFINLQVNHHVPVFVNEDNVCYKFIIRETIN